MQPTTQMGATGAQWPQQGSTTTQDAPSAQPQQGTAQTAQRQPQMGETARPRFNDWAAI
ncbi:hypothetical protein [Phaeovulum veldkampii]|uniref:hypothetical protein n=1 Tax=Phaeovulum veldkampii TaxID=33049 RepID=UPI0010F08B9E|nr:hypothetical protein [Phaeovulum veldkampii]TDQ64667.1 hypothetical protein EV658_101130 [Phaeovulum veldkampii DSM 11550]